MEEMKLSVPTIEYVENLQRELAQVKRIVKKGLHKFSMKTEEKCLEYMDLLDKHQVPYKVERLEKIDLIILSVDNEKEF